VWAVLPTLASLPDVARLPLAWESVVGPSCAAGRSGQGAGLGSTLGVAAGGEGHAVARRESADYAVGCGASVRRSCALLQVSRSPLGYASTMPARDAELAAALIQISTAHATYGHQFA